MRQLEDKFNKGDGTPFTLDASEWNDAKNNLNKLISSVGLSFLTDNADQLSEAIRFYGSGLATHYSCSGASNAYVLAHVSPTVALTSYKDGLIVEYEPNHLNNGPATANVSTLGAKAILSPQGLALTGGELAPGIKQRLKYVTSLNSFIIDSDSSSYAKPTKVNGFVASVNTTDSQHDLDFTPGNAYAENANFLIESKVALTKRFDTAWAAGNNNGGLLSGTLDADSTYHVYAIFDPTNKVEDKGAVKEGTSITANLPGNYTYYRRIMSFVTDGSGNIIPFRQSGNKFTYSTPVTDLTNGTTATTATLHTLTLPDGILIESIVNVSHEDPIASSYLNYGLITSPLDTNVTPSQSLNNFQSRRDNGVPYVTAVSQTYYIDTDSAQIRTRFTVAIANILFINTFGYRDLGIV